jgi:hypothetical protein
MFSFDTQSFLSQALQQQTQALSPTETAKAWRPASRGQILVTPQSKTLQSSFLQQLPASIWQHQRNPDEVWAAGGVVANFLRGRVDILVVWGQIIFYLTRVGPRDAIRIVAKSGQQHDPDAAEEPTPSSCIVGRCFLLLLAILQPLKLYAQRGIPWTQAFGASPFPAHLSSNFKSRKVVIVNSRLGIYPK